ncbi:MAG: hypothetical protein Q7S00_02570, partial [bacterium]|nr:hypothetical protein [bacterium]
MADGPTGVSGSLREESLVDFSDLLYAPTSQKTFSKEDVERQQVVDWLRRTTASQTTSPTLGPLPSSPAPAVLGTETRLSASLNTEGQEELEVSFHALVAAHINDLAIFQRADSIHQTEGRIQALTARPFSLSCGNEHHRTSSSVFPLTAEEKKELAHLREDLSRFQKDQAKSKRELETRVLSSFRNILGLSKTEPWEPSQIIYAVIGDHLAAGGIPFADYFFEKAAEASVASADYYWNKLRAIQQLPPGQLDEKIGEIQKIREALPLMTLAVESGDASLLFPTIRYSEIPEIALAPPEETIGSREQVAVLDALSWGLLYEALLGEAEPNTERLDQLEKERRETVLARLEEAGPIEAQLHADNFLKVATIHSLAGGRIEQAVRVEESQKSNAFYIQLRYDQQVIEQLLSPHHQEAPGNPAFEKLAEINWLLHWEALLSLGAYENALSAMDSSVLPRFQESLVIGHHLENLRKTNPHLFTEEGQWGPHDMTETEIGREASDRTASNYWFSSNETREFGVPLGSASVGALLGYLLGNIPGAVIGGGL